MQHAAPHDLRENADRALFDRVAHRYARKDIVESSRIARRAILLRALEPVLKERPSLGTVVDIGCGPGGQALHLAGLFDRYIGIDQSTEMVRAGQQLTEHLDGVEFIAANIKSPDLPSEVADIVLSVGVLHHMTDIPAALHNLARVARPNALFVAIEPQSGNPLIQLMRHIRARVDSDYSADQQFFRADELKPLLRDGGLEDVDLSYQSFLTQPFGQVILPPQWVTAPLSRAAAKLEPVVEAITPGRLSWLLVAYGRFAG